MAHKKKKKKKKAKEATIASPKTNKDWMAENDGRTLTEAAQIEKDPKRKGAARKSLHKQQAYIAEALKP